MAFRNEVSFKHGVHRYVTSMRICHRFD